MRIYRATFPRLAIVRTLLLALCVSFTLSSTGAGANAFAQRRANPTPLSQQLEAERLLAALGYWTGPVDGTFDAASRHALIAFQKVEGRPRTGRLTPDVLQALRNARRPTPRESGTPHVEVDMARQVLFVVDGAGTVTRILPVSTGNGRAYESEGRMHRAITPRGRFRVERKINGWRRAPLGLIYYPSYFHGGVAIHGSQSIPTSPASHGCVRVPMFAARELSEMLPVGTPVLIY